MDTNLKSYYLCYALSCLLPDEVFNDNIHWQTHLKIRDHFKHIVHNYISSCCYLGTLHFISVPVQRSDVVSLSCTPVTLLLHFCLTPLSWWHLWYLVWLLLVRAKQICLTAKPILALTVGRCGIHLIYGIHTSFILRNYALSLYQTV